MRMLNSAEMMVVVGGDGALPPCPPCPPAGCPMGDDVDITGRRPRRSPNATTGAFDPIVISGSINLQLFALSWQAQMDAETLLWMEAGRPSRLHPEQRLRIHLCLPGQRKQLEVDRSADDDGIERTGRRVGRTPRPSPSNVDIIAHRATSGRARRTRRQGAISTYDHHHLSRVQHPHDFSPVDGLTQHSPPSPRRLRG